MKQGKLNLGVGGVVMLLIIVLLVLLYFGGLGAGFGLVKIFASIPSWGWIVILFVIFMMLTRKK